MATIVADDALALQRWYYWEKTAPDRSNRTGNRIEDAFSGNFEHWARMGKEVVWHGK